MVVVSAGNKALILFQVRSRWIVAGVTWLVAV